MKPTSTLRELSHAPGAAPAKRLPSQVLPVCFEILKLVSKVNAEATFPQEQLGCDDPLPTITGSFADRGRLNRRKAGMRSF